MKKKHNPSCLQLHRLFALLIFLSLHLMISGSLKAQGPMSFIGDRENIGLYGGPADDLAFVYPNQRLFGAVNSAGVLFYSDDLCTSWTPAFPIDSMEFQLGMRGWGGSARRVVTNIRGWVAVQTEFPEGDLSASVVSYNMGSSNSFHTAMDPWLLKQLTGHYHQVTATGLSEHFLYTALGPFLTRTNDTLPFGPQQLVARVDTLTWIFPEPVIRSIAVANHPSGFPVFLCVEPMSGGTDGLLLKYDGTVFTDITSLPVGSTPVKIFTHPGQITGDTLFLSINQFPGNMIQVYRSLNGGMLWVDITPVGGTDYHLADADFSPDWQTMMPFSNGLRLSFPGGRISDDLGYTWQGPALLDYGVATHPLDPDLMVGSNHIGTAVSNTGPYGPFINKANIGFTRIHVRQIAESKGVYYAATDAGLAWTKEYFNPAITGYDQWIPPNGLFPIPNVGDETGVSAVTVDPNDSLHVICGFREGFFVSFTGPTGFFQVIPQDWNMIHLDPFVTDILFVNPNLVIAITGYKFREVRVPPPQPVGNIWRSTDGGLSWYMVTPFFPDEFTMGNTLALGFDGFQVQLYAGSGHQGGIIPPTPGALWKSTNMGNTWFKVNDGPFSVGGIIQPVFDLDVIPGSTEKLFLAADEVVARSNDGGISYMISGVPGNVGSYYSVLIDPVYPDSVNLGAGRNLLKYNYLIDEADLKFRGLPGEPLHELALGSTLAGTSTGGHKIEEAKRYYLDLTLFIEGPFNGITMDTTLNAAGYLPLSQPFNTSPWNYNGTESVTAIPNSDVVDWVLVELREAGSAPAAGSITRFDRQACFLLRNGKISGKDGASSPRFNLVVTEDIYGVIYSPNHIPVMSANALSLLTETFAYNFSTGATQVYGGSNGHKQLAAGVWGMFSGDGDADGQVTMGDKVDVWAVQSGSSGYLSGDFNRDSQVNNTDKIYYWGPNAGVGSQVVP